MYRIELFSIYCLSQDQCQLLKILQDQKNLLDCKKIPLDLIVKTQMPNAKILRNFVFWKSLISTIQKYTKKHPSIS